MSFRQKCASPLSSSISFFWMVLVVCVGFNAQIFVDQLPHGGLSSAKSFGGSPGELSVVATDELGHSLHVSGCFDRPRSARSRGLLQTAPRPQPGLDPLGSLQSDAAVQRHLRIRPPGSRRGVQMLHHKLSLQPIIHD